MTSGAIVRYALLGLTGLGLLYGWSQWPHWRRKAEIGAGFAARIACSCRAVEGRPLSACYRDLRGLEGMWMVHLSDRADGRAVEANVPLLARRSARLQPGFGCVIAPTGDRVAAPSAP